MSDLPIIEPPPTLRKNLRPPIAAFFRCLLCLAIAAGLRITDSRRFSANEVDTVPAAIDLTIVSELLPEAKKLSKGESGLQRVLNSDGRQLAQIARTHPAAKDVIGYRGPSNVALILNEESTVTAAFLISSDDTPEHVAAIARDTRFFDQFRGWRMGEPDTFTGIDATTGATLTSLAIAESIAVRLGGEKPSLRFPNDLQTEDLKLVFDNVKGMKIRSINNTAAVILDADGKNTGTVIRTGPLADSIVGYQGPSELLLTLDTAGTVTKIALRTTYDNEPYAGYLNEEPYFWKVFQGKSTKMLSELDVEAERIEGVSGATMTSLAVADTIVAAAAEYERRRQIAQTRSEHRSIHWGHHDTGTAMILLGAIVIGMSRLRGIRWISVTWNLILLGYFGLVTGNLVSLAVLGGWSAKGFAWRFAPGLAATVFISLAFPAVTKRNIYCTHICPHGAAQQLLRKLVKPRWKLSQKLSQRLNWIPVITLLLAVIVTAIGANWNLAAWEPFNAYIWYVAGAGSIAIAVISLLISAAVPMAYCRYGCGTGQLLDYVRRTARSDRFHLADAVALTIAVALWANVFFIM